LKILINALSGIGDALMFTPALRLLRESLPEAEIDAMVMYKGVQSFYELLDEIDTVRYFDFLNSNSLSALKFVLSLRGKYDASINVYPSNRIEYNVINLLCGASKRAGIDYLRKDVVNFGFLNNIRVKENDELHNIEENVALAEKIMNRKFEDIPKLKFPVPDEDKSFADKYFAETNIPPGGKTIGIHAGCSTLKNHIKRRWAPEKFAELCKLLAGKEDVNILLFGGPDEYELNEFISEKSETPKVRVVKTETLLQTAAVMSKCDLFITNDSGLMHIAAALDLKIIPIIGPTSLNYIHPWKADYKPAALNLDCSPCFRYSPKPLTCKRSDLQFKCLKELEVELVYQIAVNFN
jgi:heptosyltransferase-2